MTDSEMQRLIATVERFRGPEGCAWFEAQTHRSLTKYLLEESAELVEAIETDSDEQLCEELGDVLFQVLFHANLAAARGAFTLETVAREQRHKLEHRNPHVFGANPTRDIAEIIRLWDTAKAIEKQHRTSVLDGIARAMPALALADKVLGRAALVDAQLPASASLADACASLPGLHDLACEEAKQPGASDDEELRHREQAFGDALLAAVAAARNSGIDSERALREAVRRLEQRIRDAERQR